MNERHCTAMIPIVTLTGYWLGELDAAGEADVEEHLFGCDCCTRRLSGIVQLGEGIRKATREGRLHAVLGASFVEKLREDGFRVREYRLQPGGSVACTVGPEDDFVVAHLHAPMADVRRLDLVLEDAAAATRVRMHDVAFDPRADEVVLASDVVELRKLTACTLRVQLIAVEDSAEQEIGRYTFNHSAWEPPA